MATFSSRLKYTKCTSGNSNGQSIQLDERIAWLQQQLMPSVDLIIRRFTASQCQVQCGLLYINGLVDTQSLEDHILKPLMNGPFACSPQELHQRLFLDRQLATSNSDQISDLAMALQQIIQGEALLLIDGEALMLSLVLNQYDKRSIDEPKNEVVIRGPREAFVEDLATNLTLIRRRIKHPKLKTERYVFGTYTQTTVILTYIEGLCKEKLVCEVRRRLSEIKIDGVLESSYIEEFIEDNPYSPFPQMETTERPDVVCAELLEGKFAIFVDGTPVSIVAPVTISIFMQSSEDYYQRFHASIWIRLVRYVFMFASLILPSFYIAVTTFNPEMMPTPLLISVAAARELVPFPALVEAILMELFFEALREAGIRIPQPIGQAISILGALIIGQAAVQAGLVSAPIVIIVSLTGISSFVIPHYPLSLSFRLLRFPIMLLAGTLGLYGLVIGILLLYMHLATLRSFGTPYLAPIAPLRINNLKDYIIRAPWWLMKRRPVLYGTSDAQRLRVPKRPDIVEEADGD